MARRKKIVAGNWKMNKTIGAAETLAREVVQAVGNLKEVDVVLCPTFTALWKVVDVTSGSLVTVGAQNMYWEKDGAFTGEIAPGMLTDLKCKYVILGHSERRTYFKETDEIVNRKTQAAFANGLIPIVCVGETLDERNAGKAEQVVETQVKGSLANLGDKLASVVVAYEPVWAIGTGVTATPEQAQDMHAFIRKVLAGMGGQSVADAIRIQYGGSVKADNAAQIFGKPDIDGGLIGGAALTAPSFVQIVKAAV